MKGKVRTALIVLLLAVFLFGAYQIWDQTRDYRTGRRVYQAMAQYAVLPEQPDPDDGLPWPEVDFDALREVNPDIVGWIYSEDTPIHYPVVQGEDNEFYLHHQGHRI